MGQNVPGKSDIRSAQFSKTYAPGIGAPVDLTQEITQAFCATSGLFCLATATTIQLTYKDCRGTSVDLGSRTSVVGNSFMLPVGATELTTNTGLLVVAYWHGNGK